MNSLKSYREQVLISKTELARKTGLPVQTIDRIEKGRRLSSGNKKEDYSGIGSEII